MNPSYCLLTVLACLIQVASVWSTPSDSPNALLAETDFDFGRVLRGIPIEHEYRIKNEGPGPLRLGGPRLTPPLTCTRLPMQIPPGEEASIVLNLDTSGLKGPFEGKAVFNLNDPSHPEVHLTFRGMVVPPIELVPMPVFFVAAQRGQPKESSIEIINHEQEALEILKVEHPEDRFTTRLEVLEAGRLYRLILAINPDGPGGKHTETIKLHTSSNDVPILAIPANTYIKERVYTFPDLIDLGSLPMSLLLKDSPTAASLAQTLMLYQAGGVNFEAQLTSDLPMIRVVSERGPHGDRYQASIELIPEKLTVGPLTGSILIRTNDPDFPEFSVPITGTILDR